MKKRLSLMCMVGYLVCSTAAAVCLKEPDIVTGVRVDTDDGLRTHIRLTDDNLIESASYDLDGGWDDSWSKALYGIFDMASSLSDFDNETYANSDFLEISYKESKEGLPEITPKLNWGGKFKEIKQGVEKDYELRIEVGDNIITNIGGCKYNTLVVTKTKLSLTDNNIFEPYWNYEYIYIVELKMAVLLGGNYAGGEIGSVMLTAIDKLDNDFWVRAF